jgi:UDP-glucuronate 4-epimerase
MKYLITGVAGFIGFHLAKRLLENGKTIIGIDNLNDYYDVKLKLARLKELEKYSKFQFDRIDIADKPTLNNIFQNNDFDMVFNLAGQAGVRYSTINPEAFILSNIVGFVNLLECCRFHNVRLIYASSSSVYGDNQKMPFSENDKIETPKNLYAKTKIENEVLANIYSKHFDLQIIGLRFFSVYGTWGRPDMAYMIFADKISKGLPIDVFGNGKMKRDFTHVSDVVTAIEKISNTANINKSDIFNIGNSTPISILEIVKLLEKHLQKKAIINFQPLRPEEIIETFADCSKLENTINFKPKTYLESGIDEFVKWYKDYYLCGHQRFHARNA